MTQAVVFVCNLVWAQTLVARISFGIVLSQNLVSAHRLFLFHFKSSRGPETGDRETLMFQSSILAQDVVMANHVIMAGFNLNPESDEDQKLMST